MLLMDTVSKKALYVFLACLLAFSGTLLAKTTNSESRIALVIGNADYKEGPLDNPVNDANAVSSKLKKLGFEVKHLTNASKKAMTNAIRDLTRKLNGKKTIGLFYYAGHGVEISGENYLVPIGADIQEQEDVEFEAVPVGRLISGMKQAGNGLNLVVLDACRNNPFASSFRSKSRGLARILPPSGTMVFYATEPGKVAEDGDGTNGTFTKHLLASLEKPGLKVEEVFKDTAMSVRQETGDRQIPWTEGMIFGDFYFVKNEAKPKPEVVELEQKPAISSGETLQPSSVPPPPVATGNRGHLQVNVNVAAKVLVNGVDKGEALPWQPLNLSSLKVGDVLVEIQAKGYDAKSQTYKIRKGQWTQAVVELNEVGVEPALSVAEKPGSPNRISKPDATQARLIVRSNVYGDEVFINGESVGSSKINKKLSPGLYDIKVIKTGFEPVLMQVKLKAGAERTLWAKFVKQAEKDVAPAIAMGKDEVKPVAESEPVKPQLVNYGTLEILPNVAGAKVYLDGVEVGRGKMEIDAAPGRHKVWVVVNGYETFSRNVTLRDKERRKLWARMRPGESKLPVLDAQKSAVVASEVVKPVKLSTNNLGTLEIVPNVANAKVFIDGVEVGRGEIETEVAEGRHEILVMVDGYEAFTRDVTLRAKERRKIWARMHQSVAATVSKTGLKKEIQVASLGASSAMQSKQLTSIEPSLAMLNAGCFTMGSQLDEKHRDTDERPHEICVDDVMLAKHEVTYGQFKHFVDETGFVTDAERNTGDSTTKGCWSLGEKEWQWIQGRTWKNSGFNQNENSPVVCVSWNDTQAYIKWLSDKTGKPYRLATEAEWEYGARSNKQSARFWGKDITSSCQYANVADEEAKKRFKGWQVHGCSDGYLHTAPVGNYKPNNFGLYDMLGNVSEWTCSGYYKYSNGSTENNCASDKAGIPRVYRGGSWFDSPERVRAAYRSGSQAYYRDDSLGFRLAVNPEGISPDAKGAMRASIK